MPEFDIVFEKLAELELHAPEAEIAVNFVPSAQELNEIEELRRFSAEISEPEPVMFTAT
jgi:hypothetical protein